VWLTEPVTRGDFHRLRIVASDAPEHLARPGQAHRALLGTRATLHDHAPLCQTGFFGFQLLCAQGMCIAAASSYLAEHGTPRHPRELAKHRCINLRTPTNNGLCRWELKQKKRKLEVAVDGPLIVNENELALAAALQGVGLACLFEPQAEHHLGAGELVRVLHSWSPKFAGFYLYHPNRRQPPPPLRAFIDFFRCAPRTKSSPTQPSILGGAKRR
jgi:DNA-binding transcriptional LysR family regulator